MREEIVAAYREGGESYGDLALRYGIAKSTVHRWVKAAALGEGEPAGPVGQNIPGSESDAPAQVRWLRSELEKARLHNELLNAMIDIAEEQMGVSIRKKPGAKR